MALLRADLRSGDKARRLLASIGCIRQLYLGDGISMIAFLKKQTIARAFLTFDSKNFYYMREKKHVFLQRRVRSRELDGSAAEENFVYQSNDQENKVPINDCK